MNLLDDTSSTNSVDLSGLDNLESDIAIVLIVGHARKRGPDACMDICVVLQETLHGCVVEVGAYGVRRICQSSVLDIIFGHLLTVVDRCHLARCTAKNLRLPCVKVTVEMDDSHGSIRAVHAAEQRQSDGVIAAHGDHAWESLIFLRKSRLVGVSGRVAHEDAVVAFLDLVDGPLRIVRSDWDIAAVDNGGPAVEWVGSERHVVASTIQRVEISYRAYFGGKTISNLLQVETTTALPDTLRSETRARPVARAGIVRSSEEGNVVLDLVGGQARSVLETTESRNPRENRIRLGPSIEPMSIPDKPFIPGYRHHQEVCCTKDLGAVPPWESGRRDGRGRRLRQQGRQQQRSFS